MSIFLISDTHWSHTNILTMGDGRPFDSIGEHNQALIDNWNSVVTKRDTVIHLGDVAFSHRVQSLPTLNLVKGRKILIPGNHDYVSGIEKKSKRDKWRPIYGEYFDKIWKDTVKIGRVVMSHYPPIEIPDHGEERFEHMRPKISDGSVFIFGHAHINQTYHTFSNGSRGIHVGVDSNGYQPLSAEEALMNIGFSRKEYSNFERSVLDKAAYARGTHKNGPF